MPRAAFSLFCYQNENIRSVIRRIDAETERETERQKDSKKRCALSLYSSSTSRSSSSSPRDDECDLNSPERDRGAAAPITSSQRRYCSTTREKKHRERKIKRKKERSYLYVCARAATQSARI